ncbi:hypothetical protein V2J09_018566 [Rumex salicifolius]
MNSSDCGQNNDEIGCHVTSGGMFVQKRETPEDETPIRIKVTYGSSHYDVSAPSSSTFGYVKTLLAQQTGLDPEDQRLYLRGREKDDAEILQAAGIRDLSKLLLLERPASKERKIEEMKKREEMMKTCGAIAEVSSEVDKLYEKVSALEATIRSGTKVEEREFIVTTELLMRQLLKLDCIEAEGEARLQRKNEVRRIQGYVDNLDALKGRNSNPVADCSNSVSVTTQWETFDSGVGSLTPPSNAPPKVTQDWERFE